MEDRPGTSSSSCLPNKINKRRDIKIYSLKFISVVLQCVSWRLVTLRTEWIPVGFLRAFPVPVPPPQCVGNAFFEILGAGQCQLVHADT